MNDKRHGWRTELAMLVVAALVAGSGLSCESSAATSALINTTIAVGAAAVQRASGGCYSTCAPGTACNPQTGYCDPIPCGGQCEAGEACYETPTGEQCMPVGVGDPSLRDDWEPESTPVQPGIAEAAPAEPAPVEPTPSEPAAPPASTTPAPETPPATFPLLPPSLAPVGPSATPPQ